MSMCQEKTTAPFTVLTNNELQTIVKNGTSSAGLAWGELIRRGEKIEKKKLKSK